MYENLLALHTVDQKNQDVVTIKDIYIASKSAGIQSANKPAKRLRAFVEDPQGEFIWPVKEEEFIITIQELEPCICAMIQSEGRQ